MMTTTMTQSMIVLIQFTMKLVMLKSVMIIVMKLYCDDSDNNVTDGSLLNYLLCQRLDVNSSILPTVHAARSENFPAFVNMDIHGQTLDMSVWIPPQL